jgi:hypothetical protein
MAEEMNVQRDHHHFKNHGERTLGKEIIIPPSTALFTCAVKNHSLNGKATTVGIVTMAMNLHHQTHPHWFILSNVSFMKLHVTVSKY